MPGLILDTIYADMRGSVAPLEGNLRAVAEMYCCATSEEEVSTLCCEVVVLVSLWRTLVSGAKYITFVLEAVWT